MCCQLSYEPLTKDPQSIKLMSMATECWRQNYRITLRNGYESLCLMSSMTKNKNFIFLLECVYCSNSLYNKKLSVLGLASIFMLMFLPWMSRLWKRKKVFFTSFSFYHNWSRAYKLMRLSHNNLTFSWITLANLIMAFSWIALANLIMAFWPHLKVVFEDKICSNFWPWIQEGQPWITN